MSIFPTMMKLKMSASCDDGRVTMLRGETISQSQNSCYTAWRRLTFSWSCLPSAPSTISQRSVSKRYLNEYSARTYLSWLPFHLNVPNEHLMVVLRLAQETQAQGLAHHAARPIAADQPRHLRPLDDLLPIDVAHDLDGDAIRGLREAAQLGPELDFCA